ncbi:MAG TPA: chemotaxis protein CheW, partial [Rhizobiales bacterium]|nr:chemotaxis protein CheW [Hyphomicrobiales bacterium]
MNDHTNKELDGENLDETIQYVTIYICDQLFGLQISRVHDVFVPESMTRVPLSRPEVAGVLNLRGRIVTAIDMRRRLGLKPLGNGENL